MRRYVSNDQDWEKVDDEDSEEEQDDVTKLNPERESGPLSMEHNGTF